MKTSTYTIRPDLRELQLSKILLNLILQYRDELHGLNTFIKIESDDKQFYIRYFFPFKKDGNKKEYMLYSYAEQAAQRVLLYSIPVNDSDSIDNTPTLDRFSEATAKMIVHMGGDNNIYRITDNYDDYIAGKKKTGNEMVEITYGHDHYMEDVNEFVYYIMTNLNESNNVAVSRFIFVSNKDDERYRVKLQTKVKVEFARVKGKPQYRVIVSRDPEVDPELDKISGELISDNLYEVIETLYTSYEALHTFYDMRTKDDICALRFYKLNEELIENV